MSNDRQCDPVCLGFQFEYQQAQLEAEIENLSWKIEHAETTDRGDLENQVPDSSFLESGVAKFFFVQ
jgi:hypothetical protein